MWDCSRCQRRFAAQRPLQQHYLGSGKHYRCDICQFDGLTPRELSQHRSKQHRIVCQGSTDDDNTDIASQKFADHQEEADFCESCEDHIQSPNDSQQHQTAHAERLYECYGCPIKFTACPVMIMHIESGECESGLDKFDLHESAGKCFDWKAYIDGEYYRQVLIARADIWTEYGDDAVWPFNCLECGTTFQKLSDLFLHVDSEACKQKLHLYPMRNLTRWFERDYRQQKQKLMNKGS